MDQEMFCQGLKSSADSMREVGRHRIAECYDQAISFVMGCKEVPFCSASLTDGSVHIIYEKGGRQHTAHFYRDGREGWSPAYDIEPVKMIEDMNALRQILNA